MLVPIIKLPGYTLEVDDTIPFVVEMRGSRVKVTFTISEGFKIYKGEVEKIKGWYFDPLTREIFADSKSTVITCSNYFSSKTTSIDDIYDLVRGNTYDQIDYFTIKLSHLSKAEIIDNFTGNGLEALRKMVKEIRVISIEESVI